MLFLTRWFGVTGSDADRNLAREHSDIEEITERSLLLQSQAAAKQNRKLARELMQRVCARDPSLKYSALPPNVNRS
jgi:hypothetical protein